MKIVVCIKQVPDTAEVKLDPKTNTLIREGVPSIINHDDKAGLETALRLREQVGGTVSVVCMGPPQADIALREALAMGADEAYLLSAREFGGSDTYATLPLSPPRCARSASTSSSPAVRPSTATLHRSVRRSPSSCTFLRSAMQRSSRPRATA